MNIPDCDRQCGNRNSLVCLVSGCKKTKNDADRLITLHEPQQYVKEDEAGKTIESKWCCDKHAMMHDGLI